MAKIIHPELSYSIMDTCYKVYNELGYDLKEKYFHRAISLDFDRKKIDHERERNIIVYFQGKPVGEYFLDFVVDNKITVEVKVHPYINLG
ncbi:MAG: GxxExxY protein [Parcubacteria group bacterium]